MANMIARRNYKGNLTLNIDDVRFGTLFLRGDGGVSGASFTDDEVAEIFRQLRQMPIDTVQNALVRVRRAYEIASAENNLA